MRRHALLRQLTEPPRDQTRAKNWTSSDCVRGAWRTLAVLLSRRSVQRVLIRQPLFDQPAIGKLRVPAEPERTRGGDATELHRRIIFTCEKVFGHAPAAALRIDDRIVGPSRLQHD